MTPLHQVAWCAVLAMGMTGCTLLGLLIVALFGPSLWALMLVAL